MALATPPPLEAAWETVLAAALDRTVEPRVLSLMVERLSRHYRGEAAIALVRRDELAARALFWFPRDLRKVALPVAELAYAGLLPDRPLRLLDLGAGLGATCLGVARALPPDRALGHVTAVDRSADALALLRRITAGAVEAGLVPAIPDVVPVVRDLGAAGWGEGLGEFDLVTAGNAFVELTRALPDERARGEALAAHLATALGHVAPDGALVVLEPAGRDEARSLQHARDLLVARGATRGATRGVTVFAPCLHAGPCPMLVSPRDWCHEDLADVALPPWLVPIARAAGLRYEGLTFAYLVLRRDGRTLAEAVARGTDGGVPLRLISRPFESKGKTEVVACGAVPGPTTAPRLMELRRDARGADGQRLEDTERGDLVALAPGVAERAREGRPVRVAPGEWVKREP